MKTNSISQLDNTSKILYEKWYINVWGMKKIDKYNTFLNAKKMMWNCHLFFTIIFILIIITTV